MIQKITKVVPGDILKLHAGNNEEFILGPCVIGGETPGRFAFTNMNRPTYDLTIFGHHLNVLAHNVTSPNHPSGCLILSIVMPLMDRLPKVAAVLDTAPRESYAHMSACFGEQIEKGSLPKDFDVAAAISLIMDLGAAMIMQARAGAPLEALKAKAIRNTNLVLITGQGSLR